MIKRILFLIVCIIWMPVFLLFLLLFPYLAPISVIIWAVTGNGFMEQYTEFIFEKVASVPMKITGFEPEM